MEKLLDELRFDDESVMDFIRPEMNHFETDPVVSDFDVPDGCSGYHLDFLYPENMHHKTMYAPVTIIKGAV